MILPLDLEVALEGGTFQLHHFGLLVGIATKLGLVAIGPDIKDVRLGTLFRAQHLSRVCRHQVRNFAVRIVQVTKYP